MGHIQRGARAQGCEKHIHQLHVCLPAGPRSTRLLYRMSMDFAPWARKVPGLGLFWKWIAGQVREFDPHEIAAQFRSVSVALF